jgi:hypothetical protein
VHGTALPFGRYGLRGTVAARFWIYQRRDPLSLIYWGIIAIIMVVASVSTVLTPRYLIALIISGFFGGAFVGVFHANAIGMSGPAFGLEATALNGRRGMQAYFSGQDLAIAVIAVPLLTAVSFGLAAVAKHPVDGFLGMAVDLVAIGAGLALANIFSAASPYPVEKRSGTPTPRAVDGYMGQSVGVTFLSLIAVLVAALPIILGVTLTATAPTATRMPLLVLGAAVYGLALTCAGVAIAAQVAERKVPELYQIAVRSKL